MIINRNPAGFFLLHCGLFLFTEMLKKYRSETGIILIVHLAFLVYQLFAQNFLLADSQEYLDAADNLLSEGILYCGDLQEPIDPALYTKRPAGYPLFLSLTRFFTKSHVPVVILQMLLSLASVFLLLNIFKPERRDRYILLTMLLLVPAQFIYANMIMSEILFQFMVMLAAYRLCLYLKIGRIRILWSYQLFIILGILIKPVMYLFVVPNIILFVVLYIRSHQRLVLLSGFLPVVFLIIFGGYNQHRTGFYHVSSIQQINLVDYNLYFFLMKTRGQEQASETREQIHADCASMEDFGERSACLSDHALSHIKEDLPRYALFHFKGMVRFFLDPGRFDMYNFFGLENEKGRGFLYHLNKGGLKGGFQYFLSQPVVVILLLLLIALVNLLKSAGFLFFLFNKKFRPEFRLFLFLFVGFLAFATGPLGASRFMLPAALLVTGSAAIQYGHWLKAILHRNR